MFFSLSFKTQDLQILYIARENLILVTKIVDNIFTCNETFP